ncbi:DUF99 family protein [Candidatus Woesearchaeota archaeon]|nr:DUF99 family protein [Candidatus Woesearchaeota archaeon]
MRKLVRKEARVIGIDDGPFFKFRRGRVLVVGTIYRGGSYMDGVVSTAAKVDGSDSTVNIARMINKCKFKSQLRCIFLNGIGVGGFNIIDLPRLSKLTKIPVIAVTRRFPDIPFIIKTLVNLRMSKKVKLITQLPQPVKVGDVYVQVINMDLERAKQYLKLTTLHSYIPEPLRIAHIIAAGIVKGESRGRA